MMEETSARLSLVGVCLKQNGNEMGLAVPENFMCGRVFHDSVSLHTVALNFKVVLLFGMGPNLDSLSLMIRSRNDGRCDAEEADHAAPRDRRPSG